jgi:flagellar biosynthesis/type III secretory pathway protein FliH
MKSDFMVKTAKIIEEVRARTCIDKIDTEVLEEILQDALNEYYDDGYYEGYYEGYDEGYDEGRSGVEYE